MVTYIENIPITEPLGKKKLKYQASMSNTWENWFSDLFFSSQEMLLSNLKLVATLQYKPEGPHVLLYMTATKANLVSGIARIIRAKERRRSRL